VNTTIFSLLIGQHVFFSLKFPHTSNLKYPPHKKNLNKKFTFVDIKKGGKKITIDRYMSKKMQDVMSNLKDKITAERYKRPGYDAELGF